MSDCYPKIPNHEIYTQRKGKIQLNYECVPQKFFSEFDPCSLRPIAQRQLISLLNRRKLTHHHELYNEQIQKLIRYEMELMKYGK